jgi:hypothetical protein
MTSALLKSSQLTWGLRDRTPHLSRELTGDTISISEERVDDGAAVSSSLSDRSLSPISLGTSSVIGDRRCFCELVIGSLGVYQPIGGADDLKVCWLSHEISKEAVC